MADQAGEELVAMPRSILRAACVALRNKLHAPNTLAELNRYAVHGPALATPSPSPASAPSPAGEVMDELDHAHRLAQETPEGCVAEVVWYDPRLDLNAMKPRKIIDGSLAFMDDAQLGTKLYANPSPAGGAVTGAPAGWAAVYDGQMKSCHRSRDTCVADAEHYQAIHPVHLGPAWRHQED